MPYSILIRDSGNPAKWTYHLDADEAVWTGSLEDAREEVTKLLATITTNKIKVVHNCMIDYSGVVIKDVATDATPEADDSEGGGE